MPSCQIRFRYGKDDVVIQSKRTELMNDIISLYGTKLGLSINELIFFYNGNKIDKELTLAQINDKENEILIDVYPKEIEENENKIQKLNFIKSSQNTETVPKNCENINEIAIKIKIEESDLNNKIYFLDNTSESAHPEGYYESSNFVNHNHDNLDELNEYNTTLFIDGKKVNFKKSFIKLHGIK